MRGCFDRCCVCLESNCTQNKLLTDEFGIAVKPKALLEMYTFKEKKDRSAVPCLKSGLCLCLK